ncbi:endonuclease domain-containing 1 protein-like [Salvelinus fontinalis]|uniref:endonuclease domain-containing 1 protein-like n=1 Tax=Salvelinus fontinalis TaxID=8038 RepID=UPI002485C99F|nr:endonuclease domain-containing 1 protein-like [Salvelinus fontinalis]
MMGVLNHLSTLLLLSLLPPALSHVVEKFSDVTDCEKFFLEGTTPNLPGILVDGKVQDQNRYKPICQKFNNFYRFATLYDTTNRIPVFSAYTFTGPGGKRPKNIPWMIEPQLNGENNSPEMVNDSKEIEYQHQAGNYDYKNSIPSKGVNRGHLFPSSHAHDLDNQKSTFTLTNVVPQVVSFNGGSWSTMECNIREALVDNCKNNNNKIEAYVVTGAVPSNTNTLNNRVNIPDLLWTAFCCETSEKDKWMAVAHWGENQEEPNTKVLEPHTLAELYVMLNKRYGDGVQLFPDQCLNVDTPTSLPPKDGGDEHDHCVYDDDCVCSSVGVKGYYLPVVFVSVLVMMM